MLHHRLGLRRLRRPSVVRSNRRPAALLSHLGDVPYKDVQRNLRVSFGRRRLRGPRALCRAPRRRQRHAVLDLIGLSSDRFKSRVAVRRVDEGHAARCARPAPSALSGCYLSKRRRDPERRIHRRNKRAVRVSVRAGCECELMPPAASPPKRTDENSQACHRAWPVLALRAVRIRSRLWHSPLPERAACRSAAASASRTSPARRPQRIEREQLDAVLAEKQKPIPKTLMKSAKKLVEMGGLEPPTPYMRSTNTGYRPGDRKAWNDAEFPSFRAFARFS
jgi:hypothetical protein